MTSLSAQQQKKYNVTLQAHNVPLQNVFDEIRKQTDLIVDGNDELLDLSQKVSCVANNEELTQMLIRLLTGKGVICVIKGGMINIQKDDRIPVAINDSITITLTGLITDPDGIPLPGVDITVANGMKAAVTDQDGKFSIHRIDKKANLLVHAMGYWDQKISITGRSYLPVKMFPKEVPVDGVVVTAYGTSTKRFNTGSVNSVKGKNIEKQPVSNPLHALQGRVPGLFSIQNSGMPGANVVVQMGGQNSIRNDLQQTGNNPLYIIDGVPYQPGPLNQIELSPYLKDATNPYNGISNMNALNPADILSIDVFKGADATAIYGSRGTNGVISITTRKGMPGPIRFNASLYTGVGKITRKMKLLNTPQYLTMRREAAKNDGTPSSKLGNDMNGRWDTTRYTDWQKELIGGTALFKNGQISVSGGSEDVRYLLSGEYHKETTVFPDQHNDYFSQRVSTHLNLNTGSPHQRFKSNVSVNYSDGKTKFLGQDITLLALTLAPNAPPLYKSGNNLNWENKYPNPLASTKRPYNNNIRNLISSAQLSYGIWNDLSVKTNFGLVSISIDEHTKRFRSSFSPEDSSGKDLVSKFGNSTLNSWIFEPQLSYKLKYRKGEWSALLGTTFQNEIIEQLTRTARGFQSEAQMDNINAVDKSNVKEDAQNSEYKYAALFGRIGYIFDSAYIINLSGRRDASRRLRKNNQSASFWAIGAAWIFSEIPFIKTDLPFLSFGKLGASYGTTGSDQISDYAFMADYTRENSGDEGESALHGTHLTNPDYKWEKSKKYEMILDLELFDNKVIVSTRYYRNRSINQLLDYTLPPTTGFARIKYNQPAIVQNAGIELELKYDKRSVDQKFNWSTSFNLTVNKNKLVKFPGLVSSPYADHLVIGQPITIRKLYNYLGVEEQTGIYKMEDRVKDGTINEYDKTYLKDVAPKFYGGWGNEFTYKSIHVDFFFQFVKQSGYNYLFYMKLPGQFNQNQPVSVLDRWQSPGDKATVQKFSDSNTSDAGKAQDLLANSTAAVTDASYIRLKNVSISYHLPEKWLKKRYIQTAVFFIRGQNLLTITKYKGLDPENQYRGQPPLKVLTAGFNFIF